MKELFQKKRLWLLLLLPIALGLSELSKRSIYFTEEIMAKRVYKVISLAGSFLTGWIPFSLAELIVVVGPVVLVVCFIVFLVRLVKHPEKRFLRCILVIVNVACIASVIFFMYIIGCGINYNRLSIAQYCGITVRDSSKEELLGLCEELAREASELRAGLTEYENEEGVLTSPYTTHEIGILVRDAYLKTAEKVPVLSGKYAAPKGIFFSRVFSAMELTGVFTCWTMEANVNIDISDYSIPYTMAHELGHVHGFMREDEANFLACITCRESEDTLIRYSGKILALIYCGNALAGQDAEAYSKLWDLYDPGIVRDFAANREYWKQFEDTVVSNTADKVNDTYLKANHQEDGVKSYGRVVDLLLADYRSRHGL